MWQARIQRFITATLPLRTFLRRPPVRAGIKTLAFGLLLLNVQAQAFSVFSLLLFVSWSIYVFFTPVSRPFVGPIAWTTLVSLGLLMPSRFTLVTPHWAPHHVLPEHLFALIFAVLCYIFLCVAQNLVAKVSRWYQGLHAGLVWGISLLFVAGQSGAHPIRATIIGAVLLYLLSTEYFKMHGEADKKLVRFASALIATQFVEVAWALRLLPISVGYVAAILALIAVIGTSASEQYLHGTLRGPFLRYSVIVVLATAVVIAMFSRWII